MAGPYPYPESFPQQPIPPVPEGAAPYPQNVPSAYPGMLPPAVRYPKRRRWRKVGWALLALVVVAGVVAAVVFAVRSGDNAANTAGPLSDATAQTAIQDYLDALSDGDQETIARHTLCGLYDAVKERKSDMALAGLAGDAFRRQFSAAEVTSIDKIVPLSAYQAQVLFTMRVAPARGATRNRPAPKEEEQGIAQLLIQKDQILVCSYLLRAGQY